MWQRLPNLISMLRIALVIPVVVCLSNHRYTDALILFFVAGMSDGLDGFLARRFHWQSRLGAMLDPIGDKLLMVGTYLMLGWSALLPWWLVGTVIARDIIIVSGAGVYYLLTKNLEMAPSLISKMNTVVQILLVVLVLYTVSSLPGAAHFPSFALQLLMYTVLLTTIWSGLNYVNEWGRRAMELHQGKRT